MQSSLPFMPSDKEHLDVPTLETWLWDAACTVRGATDAPKFKDFILPLIFYKTLKPTVSGVTSPQAKAFNSLFLIYPDYKWNEQQQKRLRAELYKVLLP